MQQQQQQQQPPLGSPFLTVLSQRKALSGKRQPSNQRNTLLDSTPTNRNRRLPTLDGETTTTTTTAVVHNPNIINKPTYKQQQLQLPPQIITIQQQLRPQQGEQNSSNSIASSPKQSKLLGPLGNNISAKTPQSIYASLANSLSGSPTVSGSTQSSRHSKAFKINNFFKNSSTNKDNQNNNNNNNSCTTSSSVTLNNTLNNNNNSSTNNNNNNNINLKGNRKQLDTSFNNDVQSAQSLTQETSSNKNYKGNNNTNKSYLPYNQVSSSSQPSPPVVAAAAVALSYQSTPHPLLIPQQQIAQQLQQQQMQQQWQQQQQQQSAQLQSQQQQCLYQLQQQQYQAQLSHQLQQLQSFSVANQQTNSNDKTSMSMNTNEEQRKNNQGSKVQQIQQQQQLTSIQSSQGGGTSNNTLNSFVTRINKGDEFANNLNINTNNTITNRMQQQQQQQQPSQSFASPVLRQQTSQQSQQQQLYQLTLQQMIPTTVSQQPQKSINTNNNTNTSNSSNSNNNSKKRNINNPRPSSSKSKSKTESASTDSSNSNSFGSPALKKRIAYNKNNEIANVGSNNNNHHHAGDNAVQDSVKLQRDIQQKLNESLNQKKDSSKMEIEIEPDNTNHNKFNTYQSSTKNYNYTASNQQTTMQAAINHTDNNNAAAGGSSSLLQPYQILPSRQSSSYYTASMRTALKNKPLTSSSNSSQSAKYFAELFREHFIQSFHSLQFTKTLKPTPIHVIQSRKIHLPLHPKNIGKKTIVFDMDETLIHCNESSAIPADIIIPIKFPNNEIVDAGINIRPYARECLAQLSQFFELIVFTASHGCYASRVMEQLDPSKNIISHYLFRESCVQTDQGVHIKDLRIFGNRSLQDIVLVDNAAYSYGLQLGNGIPIIPYYDNKDDTELKSLMGYLLEHMRDAQDVREVNKKYFKLHKYQATDRIEVAAKKIYNA